MCDSAALTFRRTLDLSRAGSSFLEGPIDVRGASLLSGRVVPAGAGTAAGAAFIFLGGHGGLYSPFGGESAISASGSGATIEISIDEIDVLGVAGIDAVVSVARPDAYAIFYLTAVAGAIAGTPGGA